MTDSARIALLIDADNARARRLDVILNELSALGETTIRRAYGNWTKSELKGWQEILHENAIRPMQQFDPSKGKNASDMALAVDAVEILHTQRPDAFAIVSSDADFTPLVMHLREHGVAVYGFGDAKTPAAFQSACTRFLVLDRLSSPAGRPTGRPTRAAPRPPRPAEAPAATGRRSSRKATAAAAAPRPRRRRRRPPREAAAGHAPAGATRKATTKKAADPAAGARHAAPSCARTASSSRSCAAPSRAPPTSPGGRGSAPSASASPTSPRSTPATTGTPS